MSQTQSLGPARGRVTEQELDATQTIFGRFLLALRTYTTSDQPVAGKTVVWCDDQPEQIVLAGMSVLLPSFASQAGLEMRTAMQVREVAERLNRRLSAGILIHFKAPEAAAKAFYEQVIVSLRRAHTLGYRPGMELGLSTWKLLLDGRDRAFTQALPKGHMSSMISDLTTYYAGPTTLFFAPLLKSAREFKERLASDTNHLHDLNRIEGEHEISYSHTAQQVGIVAETVLNYLDETRRGPTLVPEGLLTIEGQVAEAIEWCTILRSFHVNLSTWTQTSGYVDWEWFVTQILLSFTDVSSSVDAIPNIDTYQTGLRALLASSDDQVVEVVCDRLKSRATRELTSKQWMRLKRYIRKELRQMRKWNPDAVDDQVLSGILIHVSESEFLLDSALALQVALGLQDALMVQMQEQGINVDRWLAGVAFAILWPQLDSEEVRSIIKAQVLPDAVIVDNLVLCTEHVQEVAVTAMLKRKVSSKTLNMMLMTGLLTPTPDVLRTHVESIEPEILGAHLGDLVEFATRPDGERFWPTLIKAMARSSRDALHDLFQNSMRRVELCSIGEELFDQSEVPWRWYDQLREQLGEDTYHRWFLGSLASHRQLIREAPPPEGGEVEDWETQFQGEEMPLLPVRLLGPRATRETATELLREISEDDALTWAGLMS